MPRTIFSAVFASFTTKCIVLVVFDCDVIKQRDVEISEVDAPISIDAVETLGFLAEISSLIR